MVLVGSLRSTGVCNRCRRTWHALDHSCCYAKTRPGNWHNPQERHLLFTHPTVCFPSPFALLYLLPISLPSPIPHEHKIAASLTWAKCSSTAACVSAVVTTPLALMTWLITASKLNGGVLSLETTGQDYPMLAGNLVALVFSMLLCIALSYVFPQVGGGGGMQEAGSGVQGAGGGWSVGGERVPDVPAQRGLDGGYA